MDHEGDKPRSSYALALNFYDIAVKIDVIPIDPNT